MNACIRPLWLLTLLWMLGSCSLLPPPQPVALYRLPAARIAPSPAPAPAWSLRIARPATDELLNGTRILVLPEANRISAYQGARWSSPLPALWRDGLIDAFIADGRIRHLSSDGDSLQADVELSGTLSAFQSEYRAGVPVAVIRLDARLVDTASRRILASRRFEAHEPALGPEVPAVVMALGRANDRLIRALIDWTLALTPGAMTRGTTP